MYTCDYCGRYLKKKYDSCPACGSTSFKKVQNIGEVVIKEPPKDGYKVNPANFKYKKNKYLIITGISALMFLLSCIMFFTSDFVFAFIFGVPWGIIVFVLIRGGNIKEIITTSNKNVERVKKLAKNGMLIKNLKYELVQADNQIFDHKKKYKIKVIYEIEKGKTKHFESEPKYLTALGREDGTVDLLVDPNDYSNYFIDFEIY